MKSNFIRFCGIAAVLGGLYLLLLAGYTVLNGIDLEENTFLWSTVPLMPILLVIGTAGLFSLAGNNRRVQIGVCVTGLGALLMALGLVRMSWIHNENGLTFFGLGLVLLPVGLLWFGLVNRQAQVLPRWNLMPYIIGLFATLAMIISMLGLVGISGRQVELIFMLYLLILAVGWLLLGLSMFLNKWQSGIPAATTLLMLFIFLAACSSAGSEPQVSFQSPKNGDTVSSPLKVVMKAENFTIEEAGEVHQGAGHLHIIIDLPCVPAGEVILKDEQHVHFGDGRTEAELELASGKHTLCLQAADGTHTALEGQGLTHNIEVTVP